MTPNGMARAVVVGVVNRLYGAEDPAIEDLIKKVEAKIPDDLPADAACSIAVTALLQMLAFPAPGSEEGDDPRWDDDSFGVQ